MPSTSHVQTIIQIFLSKVASEDQLPEAVRVALNGIANEDLLSSPEAVKAVVETENPQ